MIHDRRNISSLLLSLLLLPVFGSCIYDYFDGDCYQDRVTIHIENDWDMAPKANPEGMAYLFFPPDSDEPWRFDFPGRCAGAVALPPGEYRFVMFNDDNYGIEFVSSECGMYVTTKDVSIGFDPEAGILKCSPDMMWADASAHVSLGFDSLKYASSSYVPSQHEIISDDLRMIVHPRQIVANYSVKVNYVENLHGVVGLKGVFCGLASGIFLETGRHSSEAVSLPFDFTMDADSAIIGEFHTFGLPDDGPVTSGNKLLLFFKLTDGQTVRREFDMSEEVRQAPNPLDVRLEIDSIRLPYAPAVVGGGGFNPEVVGWNTVVINFNV